MRVAILGQYPLDTGRLGGVEVAIVYAQRELLKIPGVTLHIITCKQELQAPRVVTEGGLTITYLPRGRLGRLTGHRAEIGAMGEVLGGWQPDIVHAHGSGLYAGAALGSRYPAVLTVHGIIYQEARLTEGVGARLRSYLDARYERRMIARCQHLMLITPYVAQAFEGVFHGQSYLVENACDARFFVVERQPIAGRLLFAGPIIPRKGVLPLLKALSLVRRERPEAHLRLAGPQTMPDYYATCQDYVRSANLGEAVTFLGHLEQEEVLREHETCTAFVLPSFQETAPMVIEQAMAAGIPSVATRAGGVPWMIDEGRTGLTLPLPATSAGNPEALAQALLQVLRDPARAGQMGAHAKEEAERRFRPENVARRTYVVYQQVIEATR